MRDDRREGLLRRGDDPEETVQEDSEGVAPLS